MKELSEEKAIDVVKQMVADGQISQDVAEKYFPELKESEDERIRESLLEYLHTLPNHYAHGGVCAPEWIAWLEKQGDKTAWSEDDEEYINDLIAYFSADMSLKHTEEDIVDWLKSLRPQSQWKPSEEQMGVIEAVINNRSFQRRHLDSLYEQLKKLRGE